MEENKRPVEKKQWTICADYHQADRSEENSRGAMIADSQLIHRLLQWLHP